MGEGSSIPDSISYPVSHEAATSHGTGDNLILPKAYRDQSSTDTNPLNLVPSADLNILDPGRQNDSKAAEQVIGSEEIFGPIDDSFHARKTVGDGSHEREDGISVDTTWSESTTVPRRNLGFVQITSLMLNAVIGGGIFNTPGVVLALTRSKKIALVLWAVGGVYSALAMLVFLEYGTALPYNGGALIYLDEVFHRPKLLATVIFSVYWILLQGSITAAKQVAVNVLTLANSKTAPLEGQIRFTAVVVETVVCLMLFFARRLCFVFNSTFAVYKIILLLVVFIAGMANSRGKDSGWNDFDKDYPGYNGVNTLSAMIAIIYSYQGWDNANYVTGEIRDCKRTLRWAGAATILITTCLYMLATLAFYAVSDYATLTNKAGQSSSGLQFAQKVFGSQTGMRVAITISIFSDQIFVTYTRAKVKQAIAWQRIIPFYRFFGKQDPTFDSPGGALVLQWIFTVIPLIVLNSSSDARVFFAGMTVYGYQIMMAFLGIGLFRLKGRMRLLQHNWQPTYMRNDFVLTFVALVFVAINIVILVMTALPESPGTIPRFYWPISLVAVIAVGIVYWGVLRIFEVPEDHDDKGSSIGSKIGLKINVYEEGDENVPIEMRFLMRDAVGDGSRRRVDYKVSGPISQGRDRYNQFTDFVFRYLGY